jgi:hypothetical protein
MISATFVPLSSHAHQETSFDDRQWICTCDTSWVWSFFGPCFFYFRVDTNLLAFLFHCLCHCLLVSRSLPFPFKDFRPFSPFTFRLSSSTSSYFHWTRITCCNLTATLPLSNISLLTRMSKREPIFVALPFLFPVVSFFSSVASLHRIISDSEDLFPFLTVSGLLLLYLCLLTPLSSCCLLLLLPSVLVFLPTTVFIPYDLGTIFRDF